MSKARRCGGVTKSGRACRAWAMRGSNPPRCRAHQNDDEKSRRLLPPPGAEYHQTGRDPGRFSSSKPQGGLQEEIQFVRLILSRLLADMQADPNLSVVQLTGIARLVFTGARTVSRLLRDQHILSGAAMEEMAALIEVTLDELGQEMGVEL